MKLYRTRFVSEETEDTLCEWDGTQLSARQRRQELKSGGKGEIATEEVEVPTRKEELLVWLNDNVKVL